MPDNRCLAQDWLQTAVTDLPSFASQLVQTVAARRVKKTVGGMLGPFPTETDWLAAYSPRHKRRLYKIVFGLSQKEMQAIHNIQQFLGQTCNFAAETPRIVEHVNAELFYDQPHLNNAFKKMTGLSPLAYFEATSILQDNLMAASYNEQTVGSGKISPKNHIQTVVGKGKISLIFLNGVTIEDAHGLLEGDGKQVRTVRITSPEYNRAALQDYVRQTLQPE